MIIDNRTYTMHPLKVAKWLSLYEQSALPLQIKYLGRLLGFFQTEIGLLNQVIHMWGYDYLADRQRRRSALAADPAWTEFMRRNEELGAFQYQENKIIVPTSFSPIS